MILTALGSGCGTPSGVDAGTGGGSGGGGAAGGGGGATGGGTGGSGGGTTGGGGGVTGLRVFITSTTTKGNLGGLAGADALCQGLATTAGLGATWKAWLSSSTVHAKDRVLGNGPWVDMIGTLVFANRAALTGGPAVSLNYDETGYFLATSNLWTATDLTGVFREYLPGTTPCAEWTSTTLSHYAVVGQTGRLGAPWTNFSGSSCSQDARLICFQQ